MSRRALWGVVAIAAPTFASGCDKVYADPIVLAVVARPDAGLTATPLAPAPCPLETQENSPCYRASAVCERGPSPDPTCNALFVCATDPAYGMYWTRERPGHCTASCPASPSAIVDGQPCEVETADGGASADGEVACVTPNGLCACTVGPDGAHAHARRWVCVQPADGCPDARPLLGQACVGDHDCDYGACAFARGTRMVCEGGAWQIEEASCP